MKKRSVLWLVAGLAVACDDGGGGSTVIVPPDPSIDRGILTDAFVSPDAAGKPLRRVNR